MNQANQKTGAADSAELCDHKGGKQMAGASALFRCYTCGQLSRMARGNDDLALVQRGWIVVKATPGEQKLLEDADALRTSAYELEETAAKAIRRRLTREGSY